MRGATAAKQFEKVTPKKVRYIKLGRHGRWEKECLKKAIIRFGFGSSSAERYPLAVAGKWKKLTQSFLSSGNNKGTATRFTNEMRLFFDDDGSTLWITFVGEWLYWGFVEGTPPKRHSDGNGV